MTSISTAGTSLRKYLLNLRSVECHCENRVKGKVTIITGATSGIGYYTALDLAKKGAILYLGCRNWKLGEQTIEKLRKLSENEKVYLLYLDLAKLSAVRDFVIAFKKRENSLDILVHNAGIFHQPSTVTEDGYESTYQTNYLGPYLLTTLLEDYFLQSQSPKIIFVSSEAHRIVSTDDLLKFDIKNASATNTFMDYVSVYGISKLAIHVYADYISKNNTKAVVILTNPGNVWTNIYRNCWRSWYEFPTRIKCAIFMRAPEEGAQSTIHALNLGASLNRSYVTENLETEGLDHYSPEVTNHLIATSGELMKL